MNQIPCWAD